MIVESTLLDTTALTPTMLDLQEQLTMPARMKALLSGNTSASEDSATSQRPYCSRPSSPTPPPSHDADAPRDPKELVELGGTTPKSLHDSEHGGSETPEGKNSTFLAPDDDACSSPLPTSMVSKDSHLLSCRLSQQPEGEEVADFPPATPPASDDDNKHDDEDNGDDTDDNKDPKRSTTADITQQHTVGNGAMDTVTAKNTTHSTSPVTETPSPSPTEATSVNTTAGLTIPTLGGTSISASNNNLTAPISATATLDTTTARTPSPPIAMIESVDTTALTAAPTTSENAEIGFGGFGALEDLLGRTLDRSPEPESARMSPLLPGDDDGDEPDLDHQELDESSEDVSSDDVNSAGEAMSSTDVTMETEMFATQTASGVANVDVKSVCFSTQRRLELLVEQMRRRMAAQQLMTSTWLAQRALGADGLRTIPDTPHNFAEVASAAHVVQDRVGAILKKRKRTVTGRAVRHRARQVGRTLQAHQGGMDIDATDSSSCASSESESEDSTTRISSSSNKVATAGMSAAEKSQFSERRKERAKAIKKRRKIQREWDGNRAEIGWRWTWLDLRLSVMETQIQEHEKLYQDVRLRKTPLVFTDPDAGCARAGCLSRPVENRTLIKRHTNPPMLSHNTFRAVSAPLVHSDRNAIRARSAMLDRSFHLVLSLPSDAPDSVLGAAREHRKMLRQQMAKEIKLQQAEAAKASATTAAAAHANTGGGAATKGKQTASNSTSSKEQPSLVEVIIGGKPSSGKSPANNNNKHIKPENATPKHGKHPAITKSNSSPPPSPVKRTVVRHHAVTVPDISPSPAPVEIANLSSSMPTSSISSDPFPLSPTSPNSSTLLQRRKKNQHAGINDIVIPQILTPSRFEPLHFKEILTPTCSKLKHLESTIATTTDTAILDENAVKTDNADVAMEDLSDHIFISRHSICEIAERNRVLGLKPEHHIKCEVMGSHPASVVVENRRTSIQTHPSFAPRDFPLTGSDIADLYATLPSPVDDIPLLQPSTTADKGKSEKKSTPSPLQPSNTPTMKMASVVSVEDMKDTKQAVDTNPIKLILQVGAPTAG